MLPSNQILGCQSKETIQCWGKKALNLKLSVPKSKSLCRVYDCETPLYSGASLVAQLIKNLPSVQETWVWSLGQEDPLEKGMTTHSSILSWEIPWTEEPGGLQCMGSQRVGHDWVKWKEKKYYFSGGLFSKVLYLSQTFALKLYSLFILLNFSEKQT